MNNDYLLNFSIPRGDTGATGPTGPTGPSGASDDFVRSFGYIYNKDKIESIFLPNNQAIQMAFPLNSIKLNTFYPFQNTIGLLSDGAYMITYSVLLQVVGASSAIPVTLTASLRSNETIIDSSTLVMTVQDDFQRYITNTVIVNGAVNDRIDLIMSADKTPDFSYTSAFLSVVKISETASS